MVNNEVEKSIRDLCEKIQKQEHFRDKNFFKIVIPPRYNFNDVLALQLIKECNPSSSVAKGNYGRKDIWLRNPWRDKNDTYYGKFMDNYMILSSELEELLHSNKGTMNASSKFRNQIFDPRYNYKPSDFIGSQVSKEDSDAAQSDGLLRIERKYDGDQLEIPRRILERVLFDIYYENSTPEPFVYIPKREYGDISIIVNELFAGRGSIYVSPDNPYYDFRDGIIDYTCADVVEKEYQRQQNSTSDTTFDSEIKRWLDSNKIKEKSREKIKKSFSEILKQLYTATTSIKSGYSSRKSTINKRHSDVIITLLRNYLSCDIPIEEDLKEALINCKDDGEKKYILYITSIMIKYLDSNTSTSSTKLELSTLIKYAYSEITPAIEADIIDYFLQAATTWGDQDYYTDNYISILMENISEEGIREYFTNHPLTKDNFEERSILFKNDIALFKACDVINPELLLKCWRVTKEEKYKYRCYYNPNTLKDMEKLLYRILSWCINNDYREYEEELRNLLALYYNIFANGRTKDNEPVMSGCDEKAESIIWFLNTPEAMIDQLMAIYSGENKDNIEFMEHAINRKYAFANGVGTETEFGTNIDSETDHGQFSKNRKKK